MGRVGEQPQGPLLHADRGRPQAAYGGAPGVRDHGGGHPEGPANSLKNTAMGKLFRRLRFWIRNRHGDAERAEELEFHHAPSQETMCIMPTRRPTKRVSSESRAEYQGISQPMKSRRRALSSYGPWHN